MFLPKFVPALFAGKYSPTAIFCLLLGSAYLAYLTLRAFFIPATMDESFSILQYVPKSIWQILTYDYPVPSANNHILNTLSIKFFTALAGTNLLSARLGNLLAGALFVFAGAWLTRRLFQNPWAIAAGLVFWLANPYLAEFFSVGRGYGMSIGLMTGSICFAFRYFERQSLFDFTAAMAVAWLAVSANFTLLNFYLCLSGIFFLELLQNKPSNRARWSIFLGFHLLLILLMYLPVTRMLDFKEFEKFGTSGFFQDTVQSFVHSFFQGNEFLGGKTLETAGALLPAGVVFAALFFFGKWANHRFRWTPRLFLAALLPGTLAANASVTLLTDATWLPARANCFFYPLLVLSCFVTGHWLAQHKFTARSKPLLIALAFSSCLAMKRTANLSYMREWWFDRDTIVILDYLKNLHIQEKRTEPIRFNCHWGYSLSFNFHLKSNWGRYAQYVQPDLIWRDIPEPEDDFEFFYIEAKNWERLSSAYELVWALEPGQRLLLRKKK